MRSFFLLVVVGFFALACRTQSFADNARGPATPDAKPEIRYYVIGDA